MAVPKVFISSTCYDLGQIRDSLAEFISNYCYECLLSERGDVFYHPDLHTHESCVNEIENCQLFILIIGGRFGGEYKYDKGKSITNAEYEAARFKKIPVFTFVKKDLMDDHKLYQKNKHNKELVEQIIFPSIENQDYAVNIFEFINQVRHSEVNNGLFSFELAKDIKQTIGKQWAGMMYDFLNTRIKDYNQKVVNTTLDNLALINKRTEDLVENLVRSLDPLGADKKIEDLDKIAEASKFYTHILRMYKKEKFMQNVEELSRIEPFDVPWFEYLGRFSDFKLVEAIDPFDINGRYQSQMFLESDDVSWTVISAANEYPEKVVIAQELYPKVLVLSSQERLKALEFILKD